MRNEPLGARRATELRRHNRSPSRWRRPPPGSRSPETDAPPTAERPSGRYRLAARLSAGAGLRLAARTDPGLARRPHRRIRSGARNCQASQRDSRQFEFHHGRAARRPGGRRSPAPVAACARQGRPGGGCRPVAQGRQRAAIGCRCDQRGRHRARRSLRVATNFLSVDHLGTAAQAPKGERARQERGGQRPRQPLRRRRAGAPPSPRRMMSSRA